MSESNINARALPVFVAFWHCLVRHAGGRLWLAVAVLLFMGALEASGLLMLLPLLRAIGVQDVGHLSGLAGSILHALDRFGVPHALPVLLAIFAILKAGQTGLRAWSGLLNLKIQSDFTCFLRARFYRAMMHANWLFVTRQRSSDITQALLDELSRVGSTAQQVMMLLNVAVIALVQVGIAFSLSPAMTALALGSGGLVAIGLRPLRRLAHNLGERGHSHRAEMAAAISEHLAGLKLAKSHGRERHHFDHFQRAMAAIAAHMLRLYRVNALTSIWLELGAVVALALFVWFAVDVRHISTGRLLVLAFAFSRLLSHVSTVQHLWHSVTQALPSFTYTESLRERFVAAAEIEPPLSVTRLPLAREIQLQNLSFSYNSAQTAVALRDVNLVLPARQVIALCGASGAGKSTLADILLGLLAPSTGRVLLDGAELAGPRLHEWRQSVGYVPQETFLFHETVRANLLWARPDATEADLRAALAAAAAEEFVGRLPQGLDTIVGDRGVRLSGGERQRVALARALLRKPTFLVLDEATSALDSHNERLVQDAIEKLHGELTIVLIAHRLSTVRFADRIVVLNVGTIAETGTWDELCRREHGVFQRLVASANG